MANSMDKIHNTIKAFTTALLAAAVLVLATLFFVLEKKDFSENENRFLEPLPAFTWETIQNGNYMESINSYLCDHFPFRDFFMGLKFRTEQRLGKKEINQVYIGKDGSWIEKYRKPENTEQIARILQTFSQKEEVAQTRLYLMLVPTASYVYQDRLPKYAPVENQMETARQIYAASGIPAIDCSEALLDMSKNEKTPLYYRTDHHWTTYGAYVGYQVFCQETGISPISLKDLEAELVTDCFYGTIYSKINDNTQKGDSITIYRNPRDKLSVFYEDTNELTDSLYNLEYTKKKDKYSLFLNNLHPLIEITNENALSQRELVLIKDSYANSMVPFLVHHFRKIHVFDTRYYKWGPSSYIRDHPDVTDVLILYNMNTLDTDLGIRGIY